MKVGDKVKIVYSDTCTWCSREKEPDCLTFNGQIRTVSEIHGSKTAAFERLAFTDTEGVYWRGVCCKICKGLGIMETE